MTDQDNSAPAVWDPTAQGGAGGWVRRGPAAPRQVVPPVPAQPPARTSTAGAVGDEGPPLAPRPYLPPTAPLARPGYQRPPAPAGPPGQIPGGQTPAGQTPAGPAASAGFSPPPSWPPPAPVGFPGKATSDPAPGSDTPAGVPPRPVGPPPVPGGYGFRPPIPAGPPDHTTASSTPGFPPGDPAAPAGHPPPPGGRYLGTGGDQEPHPYQEPKPYQDPQPYQDPPRSRTPLLVGVAVLVVLAIGAGAVWMVRSGTTPAASPQPPPGAVSQPSATGPDEPAGDAAAGRTASPSAGASSGPKGAAQAKALDGLLDQGEAAKAPIGSAVAQVDSCPATADIDSSAQVFDSAAKQRDQLLASLAQLDFSDLPGGADAAATLRTAWQQSADIDRAYEAWAHDVENQGCANGTAPDTAGLNQANDLNPQATQSKKDFVTKWNAIAGAYNLTPRTWDRI